jgi:hypothetical protein
MLILLPALILGGFAVLAGAVLLIGKLVFLFTGFYHATKPEDLPEPVDSQWDREQGREAR